MPYFRKEVLSKFIGTGCRRQMRLYLTPDNQAYRAERQAERMPKVQPPRPGLEHIIQAGEEWGAAKVADLAQTFGQAAVVGAPFQHRSGQTRYREILLERALPSATVGKFLVEAQYPVETAFKRALGIEHYRDYFALEYAQVRPDIIEVLPPGYSSRRVLPGGDTAGLSPDDPRLQLRVIDVKLTAEPSASYFAEVTYYSMVLAGWLIDHGQDSRFVVVPEAAIWPGSHDAAKLTVLTRTKSAEGTAPTTAELRGALEQDLEPVPFEVFGFRLQRFFREDLPGVLSEHWYDLPFHVDNRCKGCEFLGYPWVNARGESTAHDDHCMPTARRQDHLSRVAFVSRGASAVLRDNGVADVATLALRPPEDQVFNLHQELRATRTVVSGRAAALASNQASIPPLAGTSAVLPRWTDLQVHLSVDYDIGSAITFALGLRAFWIEPRPFGSNGNGTPRQTQAWGPDVYVVDQKDIAAERRELLAFLEQINRILAAAQSAAPATTVQFFIWDTLEYKHLTRVIGRHLQAILGNRTVQHLAWLFPPEDLLPNPELMTRRSPLTIVRDAIRALVAVPIPHYYSLLETARSYHHADLPEGVSRFSVHPLFEDALGDQIPSERAHEIWSRATAPRHWQGQIRVLVETVEKRLAALGAVTRRLREDLGPSLNTTAPNISIAPPQRQMRISSDGQLWYAFAKLNEGLTELEVHQIRAMPPHEREARFHSARMVERLGGPAEAAALRSLNLPSAPHRLVYRLRSGSREVKLREGDFNFAVAPETEQGFLDQFLYSVAEGTWLQLSDGWARQIRMDDALSVTVAALDREAGLIALDPSRRHYVTNPAGVTLSMPEALEDLGLADFSRRVILDPVHTDFFTRRLRTALQAIGNPPAARVDPLVQRATGQTTGRGARQTQHSPPADLLWSAAAMHAQRTGRATHALAWVRQTLETHGLGLNPTQWRAWEEALTRRLQLIWGPPGTGKSRTLQAVLLGAALAAQRRGQPVRILLCASTYTALDNVLLPVYEASRELLPSVFANSVARLRSYRRQADPRIPAAIDVELNARQPSETVRLLRSRLLAGDETVVVAATPSQVHNLLVMDGGAAQQGLFDFIAVDEASQMDVAQSILALCSLATEGSVVLAGDPRQLPPIHKAEAPLGLEAMVGSVFTFCEEVHGVRPVMLDVNYRSNGTLVEFSRSAGYEAALSSHSPALRLDLVSPLPAARPPDWPPGLYWTPDWASIVDPQHPACCFVYPDGRSSQSNQFEADAIASLAALLRGRLADRLVNERDAATGLINERGRQPYSAAELWTRGIGVVTPHRAQEGLIIGRLQDAFPEIPGALVRDAVDTVERFQGQERDVIMASFALGDPDAIFREEEFLLSLNRFNVLASRARAKLIVFISQEVVDHLSSEIETLRESRLLKLFACSFCAEVRPLTLGYLDREHSRAVAGTLRFR